MLKTNYIKLYADGGNYMSSILSAFGQYKKLPGEQMNDKLQRPDYNIDPGSTTDNGVAIGQELQQRQQQLTSNPTSVASQRLSTPDATSTPPSTDYTKMALGVGSGLAQGWSAINNAQSLSGTQKSTAIGDGVEGAIATGLGALGPWGAVAGAALNVINGVGGSLMNNNATAKMAKNFNVNQDVAQSSSYGGITADAQTAKTNGTAYRKAGLFGKLFSSPGNLQKEMTTSNQMQALGAGVINQGKQALAGQSGSIDMVADRTQQKNYNSNTWTTGAMTFGKSGMKIKIKPSHEGKFTEYKKKTGETTSEAEHSSDPHVRKMAVFAANAKKWKHQEGGTLNIPFAYQPRLGVTKNYMAGYGQGYGSAFQFAKDSPFDQLINRQNEPFKQISPGLQESQQMSSSTTNSLGYQDSDTVDYFKGQRDSFDQLIKQQPTEQKINPQLLKQQLGQGVKVPTGQLGGTLNSSGSTSTKTAEDSYKKLGKAAKQVNLKKIKHQFGGRVMQQDHTAVAKAQPAEAQEPHLENPDHGYTKWLDSLPKRLQETSDYDLKGYFNKYGAQAISGDQHLTDEFKKPNHVTFSKESIYSSPEHEGGEWRKTDDNKWEFIASPWNIKNVGLDSLQNYFKQNEPSSRLVIPPGYWTNHNDASKPFEYIPTHGEGGPINVIADGAFHSRKHSLKDDVPELADANITLKGIPVVSETDDGGIIQHAEVEKDELILHLDLTKEIEDLLKQGTDEAAVEAGRILSKEIVKNTKDSSSKIIKNG